MIVDVVITDLQSFADAAPYVLIAGWLQFIYWIVYIIVIALVTYLTMDLSGPQSATMVDKKVETTTVSASDTIPVLFGTRLIRGPNLVWYGHIKSTPWMKCQ